MTNKIALFEKKQIRKIWHENEWWFSVVDVIEALDVSWREPRKYWSDLKRKLIDEWYIELSEKIGQLKLISTDGKKYATDCANTETCLRIIQSIPSPKAEPFKKWLAHSDTIAKGSVHINAGAVARLLDSHAASLLPVGVTRVDGEFVKGDVIHIIDEQGNIIGLGRAEYNSDIAKKKAGERNARPVIHYDYLYLR